MPVTMWAASPKTSQPELMNMATSPTNRSTTLVADMGATSPKRSQPELEMTEEVRNFDNRLIICFLSTFLYR